MPNRVNEHDRVDQLIRDIHRKAQLYTIADLLQEAEDDLEIGSIDHSQWTAISTFLTTYRDDLTGALEALAENG